VKTDFTYEWRKQLLWGLILIGFGVAVLLAQFDLFEVGALWHYAPLFIVAMGMNKMIGYPTAKHFTDGLWEVLIGVWLFAVFENLFGLTFRNSWPIMIIVSGFTLMLTPLVRARFESTTESGNEKHL